MRRPIVRYAAGGLLIASVLGCAVAYLARRNDDSGGHATTWQASDALQAIAVVDGATKAGVTSVSAYGGVGVARPETPPGSSVLAPGIEAATQQARAMVQSAANAAGLKLGGIRSVSVATATPD